MQLMHISFSITHFIVASGVANAILQQQQQQQIQLAKMTNGPKQDEGGGEEKESGRIRCSCSSCMA